MLGKFGLRVGELLVHGRDAIPVGSDVLTHPDHANRFCDLEFLVRIRGVEMQRGHFLGRSRLLLIVSGEGLIGSFTNRQVQRG